MAVPLAINAFIDTRTALFSVAPLHGLFSISYAFKIFRKFLKFLIFYKISKVEYIIRI